MAREWSKLSHRFSAAVLLLAFLLVLANCRGQSGAAVTFNGWDQYDIPTLDPQIAGDVSSVDAIENLFLQLTNYDLETAEIVPEAATQWQISKDGLTYTFRIRSDIPWVKHNPAAGQTSQAVDSQGTPRFLNAHDFVYGIKRACDPNTGSYYSTVVAPLIRGCADVLFAPDPDHIPQELWEAIGVHAPDDQTLVIQLEFPASYFLSMTPMWTLAAVPRWAIETHGKDWIEADHIVTNGRYVLQEWAHATGRTFVRNPLVPEDLQGDGNIERLVVSMVPDCEAAYSLWLDAKVDASCIPEDQLQTHLQEFPDESEQISDQAVSYIGFRMTKSPFDDARVRRAFSAAFDRETLVDDVMQGQGLPMIHFAPPGIFGAPPIDEVGLEFDPEFARQQLAEAGYPDCEGFPEVSFIGYGSKSSLLKYAQTQWVENLDCSADRIQAKEVTFQELLKVTEPDVPDAQAPHMWVLGWAPDYPDENNWVGDVLWCKAATRHKRTCNEIDDLIVRARQEPAPQRRIELYRQIEDKLFGPEGETPFFPVMVRTSFIARHAWLDRPGAPFGGEQWYEWSIDQQAQEAAGQ